MLPPTLSQFQMAQTIRSREFALSFVESPCCPGANHRIFVSEIMGDQVVRTPASANINLGRSSACPVTVGIERVQEAGLVGARIWLDVPERGLVYEEGCLHRAIISPKPHGMSGSVVGAAIIRERNHWLEPIKLSVHKTCRPAHDPHRDVSIATVLTATPRGLRFPLSGYAEIGLQCGPSWPNNKFRRSLVIRRRATISLISPRATGRYR